MTEKKSAKRLALVGCSDEWLSRSLESIFTERGYEVTRTASGRQALKATRRNGYDVLLLDERLDEMSGIEVCIGLRDDPLFDHATPIVVISAAHSTLPGRTAAYAAGAWEYCHLPLDVDGLFLKLSTFLRAREELAVFQAKSMLDPTSGLYTPFGLHHLAAQLEARAVRNHEPFACLAFSPQPADGAENQGRKGEEDGAFADVAHLVREQARRSDVVAKTGESQLSLLAPDTDAAGARLLVARLQKELSADARKSKLGGAVKLRVGYCAVSDLAVAKVDLSELVHRAESALASVSASGANDSVVSFDELPVS
jgi:DNA-binding response OmpR family regulator